MKYFKIQRRISLSYNNYSRLILLNQNLDLVKNNKKIVIVKKLNIKLLALL